MFNIFGSSRRNEIVTQKVNKSTGVLGTQNASKLPAEI